MNPFRHLLKACGSQPPIGTWIMSGSPLVAEALGCAGFDWGVVDMEHSPLDMGDVVHLLQAIGNTKMVPVVRVPWNDAVVVKRVLDAGATTVLFPFVQNAEEAAAAVAATRYPPDGIRGMAGMSRATRFGTRADYPRHANREMGVIVQLETADALDRLDEIAAVPGVDALFLGPGDLSGTMGLPGQVGHPDVQAAMHDAARRARAAGIRIGTVMGQVEQVQQMRDAGYHFVGLASDLGLYMRACTGALKQLRDSAPGVHGNY